MGPVEAEMASEALPVERLHAYLGGLPPETQASLVATLERALLRGEHIPAVNLILERLRPAIPTMACRPPRTASPARMFFEPLTPFLTSHNAPTLPPGLIARASLTPLWNWIGRDLVREPARIYRAQANAALLAPDLPHAAQLARNFQDYVAQAISNLLERLDTDEKGRRRAAAQTGTLRGLLDVRELLVILRNRDRLADFSHHLPERIANLTGAQAEQLLVRLMTMTHANPEILPFTLVMLKGRLQNETQLIRLAVMSAASDMAIRVAQAPLAPAVSLILGELHLFVADLRRRLKENRIADAVYALRRLRDGIRGVQTELDLSRDSAWSREFHALRGEVAELLQREIQPMPALVRRLLRAPQGHEALSKAGPNEIDVADAEARLTFVIASRSFANELAVNQISREVHLELQRYIERAAPALIDALRDAPSQERRYRRAQAEAAVRFAAKVFGSEYAAQLSRAITIAGEPRAAQA